MTRDQYKNDLRNGICEVTFTKKDGTDRVMRCTLAQAHLPASEYEKTDEAATQASPRKVNPNTLHVWDMDKSAWRAFNLDSVKHFKNAV